MALRILQGEGAWAWDPAQIDWHGNEVELYYQGEPLRMEKRFRVVPRGVGLVIGCSTFPTWNGYPGLFASLATGNAVVVKPHPSATLPGSPMAARRVPAAARNVRLGAGGATQLRIETAGKHPRGGVPQR